MGKLKKNGASSNKVAMVGYKKPAVSDEKDVKTEKRCKNRIIIIAASLIVLISIIVGIILSVRRNSEFDYLGSDLTKYISLDAEDYKNVTLEIDFDEMTDADVNRKLMTLLYGARVKNAEYKGADMLTVPVSFGDTVHIYCRGYTVDENGREIDFEGGSNMLSDSKACGIGSATYLPGFEESLVGVLPLEHKFDAARDRFASGGVYESDVIYLSYSAMLPDGRTVTAVNERIDLGDPDTDLYYGEGFCDYFVSSNINIGKKISEERAFLLSDGSAVYYDMTVNYALRCPNDPFVIEVKFPFDYAEESLRGKVAKFDVYFKCTWIYDVPEYSEAFITEKLGLKAEDLQNYEGNSLTEKHYSLLTETVENEFMTRREEFVEKLVWDYYKEKATVKALPRNAVNACFEDIYSELHYTYESSGYQSFDSFVAEYYGAPKNSSAASLILADAESVITEKLILYYIIREENLVPTQTEFKNTYESIVKEHLDYYLETIYDTELKKITDDTEKAKRIAEIKAEMLEFYGEEYFSEMVYYEFAYDRVMSFVTVK